MSLDQSKTFKEMQTDVCERVGIADYSGSVAAPTTDTALLDKVKRALQDAERELWRAVDPRTSRAVKWVFTAPLVTITLDPEGDGPANIASDPTRYRLPRGVNSAPVGKMVWSDGSSSGGHVFDTSIDRVLRKAAENSNSQGPPLYAAVYHDPSAVVAPGERPPFELRVWPKPSKAFTVRARFKVEPIRLVNDGDRANRPAVHDLTVVAMAVEKIVNMGGIPGAPDPASARAAALEALVASIEADADMHPNSVGVLGESGVPRRYETTEILASNGTTLTFG